MQRELVTSSPLLDGNGDLAHPYTHHGHPLQAAVRVEQRRHPPEGTYSRVFRMVA